MTPEQVEEIRRRLSVKYVTDEKAYAEREFAQAILLGSTAMSPKLDALCSSLLAASGATFVLLVPNLAAVKSALGTSGVFWSLLLLAGSSFLGMIGKLHAVRLQGERAFYDELIKLVTPVIREREGEDEEDAGVIREIRRRAAEAGVSHEVDLEVVGQIVKSYLPWFEHKGFDKGHERSKSEPLLVLGRMACRVSWQSVCVRLQALSFLAFAIVVVAFLLGNS